MGNIDSFEEFLRKKKAQEEENKVDWEGRKEKWLLSINQLYSNIREWLKPFIDDGLITINDSNNIQLSEEYIGNYEAPRMDIFIGSEIIRFNPRGTLIIGSYGRIDVRGSKGEIMLIEPEWDNWKFARRTPKIETWDVNAESIKGIIQEIV